MINHILLTILFSLAILQDVKNRKIKNGFQIFSLGISCLCIICVREISIMNALMGFLCSLVVGILLWRLSAIRAGDAKFMWTIGVLRGVRGYLISMLFSILIGGLMAIGIMIIKKDFRKRIRRLWNWLKLLVVMKIMVKYETESGEELPFTIPMAIGCIIGSIFYI